MNSSTGSPSVGRAFDRKDPETWVSREAQRERWTHSRDELPSSGVVEEVVLTRGWRDRGQRGQAFSVESRLERLKS